MSDPADDLAALRAGIEYLPNRFGRVELLATLDRIAARAPQRATGIAGAGVNQPLWLTTSGVVVASPAGHPDWRALYILPNSRG